MKYESFAQAHPDFIHMWHESNTISPNDVSKSSSKIVTWECPDCGYVFNAPPNRIHAGIIKKGKPGCKNCYDQKRKRRTQSLSVTDPEIYALIDLEDNKNIDIESLTRTSRKEIVFTLSCGHKISRSPRTMKIRKGKIAIPQCPTCASLEDDSSIVKIYKNAHSISSRKNNGDNLYEYIVSIIPEHMKVIKNDTSVLDGEIIDILIEDLKVGITYNSLDLHGEKSGCGRNYHYNRYEKATNKGYRLITIWEDDWLEKRSIIENMLKHITHSSQKRRIFARKTSICDVSKKEAMSFMNDYHIQGYTPGTYYIGLRDEDGDIVSVSLWRKNKNVLYLDRYATSEHVIGGMGKLFSYMESLARENGFESIVTFSDHEISNGNLYEKIRMVKEKELSPDYKYVVDGKRIHKFNYRRKKFRNDPHLMYDENLSESQLAILNGIDRVWDCGKTRWIKYL